jgi:ABC-2 type transport system permease protein
MVSRDVLMLKQIINIAIKDFKELTREKRILFLLVITAYIMLSIPYDSFWEILDANPAFAVIALNFYFTYFSWLIVLFVSFAAIYRVFYKEKNSKTMASLLATPVSVKEIWLGKSLSVWLVGYGQALLLSFVFWGFLHYQFPGTSFFPSISSLTALFVINPVISFLFISALGALYLFIKDEMKVRIVFFLFIGLMFYFLKPENLILGTNSIFILLAILMGLFIVNIIFYQFLTKERIFLSMDH